MRIILGIDGAFVIWSILAPAAEISRQPKRAWSVAPLPPPPSSETKPIHGLQAKQGERPGGGGRDGRRGRCGCVPGPARLVDNPRLPPDESPSLQVSFPFPTHTRLRRCSSAARQEQFQADDLDRATTTLRSCSLSCRFTPTTYSVKKKAMAACGDLHGELSLQNRGIITLGQYVSTRS